MGRMRLARSRLAGEDGDGIPSSSTAVSSSLRRRRSSKPTGWREYVTFENVCAIAALLITILIPIWLSVTTPVGPVVNLEVRKSTVPEAGLGVFLAPGSSPVPRGTVLTKFGDRMMEYASVANTPLDTYALRDGSNPKMTRVGRPWSVEGPVKEEEPVGHMCNDAKALTMELPGGGYPSVEQVSGLVEKYEKESLTAANVRLMGDRSWNIVANKEIMPGDELFYSYGHSYWLAETMRRSMDPLARLLVYLHLGMKSPQSLSGASVVLHNVTHLPVMSDTNEAPDEQWCESFNTHALLLPKDAEEHSNLLLAKYGLRRGMTQYDRLRWLCRMAYEGVKPEEEEEEEGSMDEL